MTDKVFDVGSVNSDENYLYLMVDGQSYRISWTTCSDKLAESNVKERRVIEVSPSGYGLHWPMIDEDLAIKPLLQKAEKITTQPA